MSWYDNLTGTAFEIARTEETPLRVMAGPGTGKSFAMKRRVARLLEEGQDPSRILAVTFTRNAAASLVADLHALEIENCEKIKSGTLHSLCFTILNREDVFGYLNRVPRPLVTFNKSGVLQFEGAALLHDLVLGRRFGNRRECTKRIRAFEAAWARLQADVPGWAQEDIDRQFEQCLVSWLRFHRAMLIGELVPEALRFLRNNPASDILTSFDHVIVDEYQDLNKAEQTLIDLLASNGMLSIVGDEDQSIYSFRYANPSGIRDFAEIHPTTCDQTLDECRRCPQRVVRIADELIRRNHLPVMAPRLQPKPENDEGVVRITQWRDVESESAGLACFVQRLLERGYAPGDILIMTPRRLLGYAIRDRIREANVPVHSFFSEEPLEAIEAQRAMAIMTLLADPDDRVAMRWWLGNGSQNGRAGQYKTLRDHCEATQMAPKEALDAIVAGELRITGISQLVAKYRELLAILENLEELEIADVIDQVIPDGNDEVSMLRQAAIDALPESESIRDVHSKTKALITQPEIPEESAFVRVMSLHKAKGLTSKVAIVAGCIQGLIPTLDRTANEEEQETSLEEQRRLFYVAITRNTEILVLSSAIRMQADMAHKIGALSQGRGIGLVNVRASQFIGELGPDAPQGISGHDWADAGYPL